MAAISFQFDTTGAIVKDGDIVTVKYQDGSSRDFDSLASLQSWAINKISDFGVEGIQAIGIISGMTIDPLMDTPSVWNGKTITLDAEKSIFSQILTKV